MKIFRIEDQNGMGPYNSKFIGLDWQINSHLNPNSHPSPDVDIGLRSKIEEIKWIRSLFYCGFESMQSLNQWFHPKELIALLNAGFTVVTYECSEGYLYVGDRQVIFWKEMATKEGSVEIEFPIGSDPKLAAA